MGLRRRRRVRRRHAIHGGGGESQGEVGGTGWVGRGRDCREGGRKEEEKIRQVELEWMIHNQD